MNAKLSEHIYSYGDWGAKFICTPLVIDIFARRKIFFGRETNRFSGHEVFYFGATAKVEPYTSFNDAAFNFWTMGAFSYSASWLPPEMEVGRYCSIANDFVVFYDRHPLEWATSSSITYEGLIPPDCPDHREGYLAFLAAHKDFNQGSFPSTWPHRAREPDPRINHDVWVGQSVKLARNINIGTGAVIAAAAVVTKNVDPYMIVGGVPARVIRPRFNEKLIERFLQSKWWEYDPSIFKTCDYKNPEKFLDEFENLKAKTNLKPFAPEPITYQCIVDDLIRSLEITSQG